MTMRNDRSRIGSGVGPRMRRRRGIRRGGRDLLLGAALAVAGLVVAAPGRALTLGGGVEITPLYFLENDPPPDHQDELGFDPADVAGAGLAPTLFADLTNPRLLAGNEMFPGLDLSISQDLDSPVVLQNPQDPTRADATPGVADLPSFVDPFVAESVWTVRNTSGAPLEDVALAFVLPDFSSYPAVPVGLDAGLLQILRFDAGEVLHLGAVLLGDLGPGASTDVTVRYVVAGPLPTEDGRLVMPPLSTLGLAEVPEPGTALLLGLGVVALAGRRRRAG